MTGILMMAAGNSYGSAPVNTVAPAVTGTAQVRQTLSCSTGTWTGAPAPTFTYQWQSNSSNISGATSSTYQIVDAYVGTVIRCVVTATNSVAPGGVSANSNATSSVTANVPAAPTIGTATAASATTASVTFTAPSGPLATGGSAITGYTVYSSGGQTATGSSSPITVTGLNSETAYNFYVRANNAIGQSANSGTSNTITTPASHWMAFLDNNWSGANAMPSQSNSNGFTSIIGGGGYGNTPSTRLTKDGAVSSSAYTSSNNYVYPSGNNYYVSNWSMSGWSSGDGNEIYGGGYAQASNSGAALSKVNASGAIQWFYIWQFTSGVANPVQTIQQGEDGYIYISGHIGGRAGGYSVKLNSSGTIQWQGKGGGNGGTWATTGDGSNTYIAAFYDVSGARQAAYIYSYNSAFTTRNWCYSIEPNNNPSTDAVVPSAMVTYGGNVYFIGSLYRSGGIGFVALIVKMNSSGTIVWSRYIKHNSQTNYGTSLTVDSATGYIYATSLNANAASNILTKFDTSGNVAWQRRLVGGGGGSVNKASTVSITGSTMYWSLAYSIPNFAGLIMKLPTDGSKTGTYTGPSGYTYTYESISSWNDASGEIKALTQPGATVNADSTTPTTTGNVAGAMSTALSLLTNIP